MLSSLRSILRINRRKFLVTPQQPKSAMKNDAQEDSLVKYTITRLPGITEENRAGLSRMIDIYAAADPHITAFKVNQGRTVSDVLRNFLLAPIDQGMSFVAIDDDTKEIIGLIINHMSRGDCGVEELAKQVEHETEKELIRFWQTFGDEPKKLANEVLYNIEYNIVDPKYRKSGIALALGKRALLLGHEMGVKYVRSECSNAYTCLIAEQMEYTREFSVPYESILDSKGHRVFTKVQPPHTHLHIYILYMDQAKKKPYLDKTTQSK